MSSQLHLAMLRLQNDKYYIRLVSLIKEFEELRGQQAMLENSQARPIALGLEKLYLELQEMFVQESTQS